MKVSYVSTLVTFLVFILLCFGEARKRPTIAKDNDECAYNNGGCVHLCTNAPGNRTCTCKDGFILAPDGRDCLDKDECADNNGGCSHQCVNTLGSFDCRCGPGTALDATGRRCVGEWCRSKFGCDQGCRPASAGNRVVCFCRTGFTLHSDGKTCLRSCELGNGGCHHVCNMSADGPVCSCADKYKLTAANKTCMATCLVNNGGCEKKCVDSNQGPTCSCPAGYRLYRDGRSCIDVDECEENTHGCSHLCENVKGSFECVCPIGYKVGTDYKTCIDIDECVLNSTCDQTCVNLPGSFTCQCNSGYQLFGVTHCADVNECAVRNGGCEHVCTNTAGSYACSCHAGFKLHSNTRDCTDARQCISLVQQPNSVLSCMYEGPQEQHCTMTCERTAQLTNRNGLLNSTSMSFRCGPNTDYEWTDLGMSGLPHCSESIAAPAYSRKVRLVFIGDSCDIDKQDIDDMKQNLTHIFNHDKNYMCKNRCSVNFLDLMCGTRRKKFRKLVRHNRKSLITAEFELQLNSVHQSGSCDVNCMAKRSLHILNRMLQKFKRAVRQQKYSVSFKNKEFKPVKKSLKLEKNVKELCRDGMQLINNSCIACPLGTSYNIKSRTCSLCLRGTFQDEEGQLFCKECPNPQPGSGVTGATRQSQCNELCEPGTCSPSGQKPCMVCQIGTFQPNYGSTSCLSCGGGLKTRMAGSTGFKDCITKAVCEPGHYYNTSTHSCSPCSKGFYQPEASQDFCLACPGRTTTDFESSTSPEDCKDRQCGHHMGDNFGVLESPNFPGNYPVNVECIWKINPENSRRILIILPMIELADEEDCGDKIVMRKSQSPSSQSTFETCESRERPVAFTARSKKLWIQFKSNGNHTAKGFSVPFVTYDEEYESLIEDIVRDGRLYSSHQHQQIFKDRQLLTALLEVIATPYNYLKYANVSHTMFPTSFFKLLTPKVRRFFQT
ncbi:hypothetical protein BsWGS_18880 [Bradybaena similaris]